MVIDMSKQAELYEARVKELFVAHTEAMAKLPDQSDAAKAALNIEFKQGFTAAVAKEREALMRMRNVALQAQAAPVAEVVQSVVDTVPIGVEVKQGVKTRGQ